MMRLPVLVKVEIERATRTALITRADLELMRRGRAKLERALEEARVEERAAEMRLIALCS